MQPTNPRVFLAALPAIAASFAVLAIAGVGRGLWRLHLLALGCACVLGAVGWRLARPSGGSSKALALVVVTLAGVAAPFLWQQSGLDRWVVLGGLHLYIAPLLLPSFLAACSAFVGKKGQDLIAYAGMLGVSLLLALQPDASQVLALGLGAAVLFVRYRSNFFPSIFTTGLLAVVTAWVFSRPDPLQPVPYVEGVFALAFSHSLLAGLAVTASAVFLVAGLSLRRPAWLSAVAAYYAVLFACSVAGLTPAPLIGYGAGPVLGFGLLMAVSRFG